ncbi:M15 family metallopeptidase [Candidatus Pacearchaeota archaeon]|nr:M15 family metallopeptidase [Candidatus Pacearchaeota archaeon]
MTLRQRQSKFARMVGLLLHYACEMSYEITLGDAWANDGHKDDSFHYKRLAIDLNLFVLGRYQRSTKAYEPLGIFWKSIGGSWGGDWGEGTHFSLGE